MTGLIVAALGASLTAKELVSARAAAIGCGGLNFVWGLLLQEHPVPLTISCAIGFFLLWGSFVVIRRAKFALLGPAVLLVLVSGATVDFIRGELADRLNMHSKPIRERFDANERGRPDSD